MMPVRQTLLTSDIQLSYLEWNQGQKPLLLLHGMADHALVWSSLGDYLAADYHIVAPDMRGHGESSKPEQDYTFASAICDLEALMDKLGWSAAHIVSHSWTGKLAAIWARENPGRLKSITLVDPIFIWKMPSFLKITFPLLYRVLPFLKAWDLLQVMRKLNKKLNNSVNIKIGVLCNRRFLKPQLNKNPTVLGVANLP
jgi:pimeloyl-ACP methyl ester carboxylesterase